MHGCQLLSMAGMNSDEIRDYKEELEKQAQLMDKINLKLAKIYANSTGLGLETIQGHDESGNMANS